MTMAVYAAADMVGTIWDLCDQITPMAVAIAYFLLDAMTAFCKAVFRAVGASFKLGIGFIVANVPGAKRAALVYARGIHKRIVKAAERLKEFLVDGWAFRAELVEEWKGTEA